MTKRHLVLTKKDDSTSGGKDSTRNAEAERKETGIIQQNSPITASQHPTDNKEVVIAPEEAVRALGLHSESTRSNIKQNFHFVRIRDQLVSRLELEASRNVILSVGIMLLFSLPWIIASILAQMCNDENVIHHAIGEEKATEPLVGKCTRYYWVTMYTRLILLIGHSLYQSVCYVTRSKDFSSALRQAHRHRCNGCCGARQPAKKVNRQPPKRMRRMRRH